MKIPMIARITTAAFLVSISSTWIVAQTGSQVERWEAQWVSWAPNAKQKWPVLYSCRPFVLEQQPASAVIRITAVDYFKLHVNDDLVGEGPPRNAPKLLSFNSFDVSDMIGPGENIVAVEVISARPRFGYADPEIAADERPAFAAQLELTYSDGSSATVVSDETWRIAPGPWHDMDAHSAGDDRVEVFEAKLEPQGWRQHRQVSSDWDRATPIAAVSPDGQPYPGRKLQASILPHYRRTEHLPAAIVRTGEVLQVMGDTRYSAAIQMATEIVRPLERCEIENEQALLEGAEDLGPATIKSQFPQSDLRSFYTYWDGYDDVAAIRNPTMIIDFGKLMNAYIQLDVEGNEDAVIDIAWGQTLIDGRVLPLLYTRQAADKQGKPNAQLAARYYLAEGRQQWETFQWQNFRYLQLTFRRLDRPLKLHRIAAVRSFQPLERRGIFRSSDSFLNELVTANANTLEAASYDLFMDNTIREKQVWGGDISDGSVSTCLAAFGDVPILRHYMTVFCDAQLPSGALPQLATHRREGPILAHQIRTVIWMAEYGLWCKDQAYYRSKVLPAIGRFLEFLGSISNEDGLLVAKIPTGRAPGPPSPAPPGGGRNWVDHVYGLQPKDVSVPVNLFHVLLLRRAAAAFEAYGDAAAAGEYRSRAETLRHDILANYWNESKGLYLDGKLRGVPSTTFSEHANYLALLEGLGGNGRADRILAALNDPKQVGKIVQTGPPFMLWPPTALFSLGRSTAALDLLRDRYSRFVKSGGDTLWEEWSYLIGGNGWGSRYRSLAQNGAGSPAWLMATEVLGVKPSTLGFEEFTVQPKRGDLEWAEGVVPSPAGDVQVSWRMEPRRYSLEVGVPTGTKAHVHLPRATHQFLGGKPVESVANVLGTSVSDGRFVVTVPAGRHRFESRGLE